MQMNAMAVYQLGVVLAMAAAVAQSLPSDQADMLALSTTGRARTPPGPPPPPCANGTACGATRRAM